MTLKEQIREAIFANKVLNESIYKIVNSQGHTITTFDNDDDLMDFCDRNENLDFTVVSDDDEKPKIESKPVQPKEEKGISWNLFMTQYNSYKDTLEKRLEYIKQDCGENGDYRLLAHDIPHLLRSWWSKHIKEVKPSERRDRQKQKKINESVAKSDLEDIRDYVNKHGGWKKEENYGFHSLECRIKAPSSDGITVLPTCLQDLLSQRLKITDLAIIVSEEDDGVLHHIYYTLTAYVNYDNGCWDEEPFGEIYLENLMTLGLSLNQISHLVGGQDELIRLMKDGKLSPEQEFSSNLMESKDEVLFEKYSSNKITKLNEDYTYPVALDTNYKLNRFKFYKTLLEATFNPNVKSSWITQLWWEANDDFEEDDEGNIIEANPKDPNALGTVFMRVKNGRTGKVYPTYEFPDVPRKVYILWRRARSKGKYFWRRMKYNYGV